MTKEEIFGEKIRSLRIDMGLSQRKAARLIGLSHMRLGELEAGVNKDTLRPTKPSKETVIKLAALYEVPSDYLFELAGYAREHPELSNDDILILDLFHALPERKQKAALKILRTLQES